MTKLDEAIKHIEVLLAPLDRKDGPSSEMVCTALDAARAYAALLKLAPEIGALVEAGEKARKEHWNCTLIRDDEFPEIFIEDDDLVEMAVATIYDRGSINFIAKAANTRPTLKAIHDNLTKWGE